MSNPTFAQGELLAQLSPSDTSANVLYTNNGNLRIEIPLILAVCYSGTPNIEVYHDDDGTTFGNSTLILSDAKAVNDNPALFQSPGVGSGLFLKPGGSIGVLTSVANTVNFSLYGITAQIAQRVREGVV